MRAAFVLGVILCLVLGIGMLRLARRSALRAHEYAWRPKPLKHAPIAYAEQKFFTERPIRLVGRIDRAYRTADGLVLMEFKRRRRLRAFASDVVELSAQRVAIECSTGEEVADHAYVVIEDSQTLARTTFRVSLLAEAGVVDLADRYANVMRGRALPRKANLLALCGACAYADRCRPDVLRGCRQ